MTISVDNAAASIAPSRSAELYLTQSQPASTKQAPLDIESQAVVVAVQNKQHQAPKQDSMQEPEGAGAVVGKSPAYLKWLTKGQATNRTMLLTRTYNQLQSKPTSHNDYLAPVLRDALMPVQSWLVKHLPLVRRLTRRALEHPKFGVPGVVNFVDGRTGWIDAAVEEGISKQGIQQVVAIAAGYDTRAYRFGRPGVSFFEVDLPSASTTKQELVAKLVDKALPRPVFIAADLSVMSLKQALEGKGFDATKKTLFTVEGLIYYLPSAAVDRLFGDITAMAAPGSRIVFDFLDLAVMDGRKRVSGYKTMGRAVANKGEPFLSGLESTPAAVAAFAASHGGWRVTEFLTAQQLVAARMPHLQWPQYDAKAKKHKPPPMLMCFNFASLEKDGP